MRASMNDHLSLKILARTTLWLAMLLAMPLRAQDLHFYLIEDIQTGAPLLRGAVNNRGIPQGDLILSPNTPYRQWLLDPVTLFVGQAPFTTPNNGRQFRLPPLTLQQPETGDSDGDGLHDIGEYILGTNAALADSDGDGIDDGAELQNGLNPLDGLAVATGVAGGADTPGQALGIHAFDDTVVVADGQHGLSIFNVFNPTSPLLIGQVSIPGRATATHFSGDLIAVVAGNEGLVIVDGADPVNATITNTFTPALLSGNPRCVVTALNLAFVGLDSGRVAVLDMQSGSVVNTLTVSSAAIDDIGLAGQGLFVLTRERLHLFDIRNGIEPRGSIAVRGSASPLEIGLKLFVGGGRAYTGSFTGFSIFDVRDLDQPVLLGSPTGTQAAIHDLVSNGSGLALAVTSFAGTNTLALSLYDDRDPSDVTQFITSFDTPGDARALALWKGLAYIADTDQGMQIVNYRAFDGLGVPPTIALQPGFDINATEEGQLLLVQAEVSDDVQVRDVAFFIDGNQAASVGSFPFEFRFRAPLLSQQSHFRLKARVFDTGGNMTETEELLVTLVADQTPPRVLRTSPASSIFGSVAALSALINEPLDPRTLIPDRFFLIEAGSDGRFDSEDDRRVLGEIQWDEAALRASFIPTQALEPGSYRATLAVGVTDLTGNSLTEAVNWGFRIFDIGVDRDGDGVPDGVELLLGLDPDVVDSNGNGILDGDEDFDGDGISNRHEVILGTDPALTDSDQNGIPDAEEDRDNDGLSDFDELLVHGTDLSAPDSDGDGFSDGAEIERRSDPLDPLSLPLRFAITPVVTLFNSGPPGLAKGQATASPVSVQNREPPGVAKGQAQGPPVSIRNQAAPHRVIGRAESPAVMVDNTAPATPSPQNESEKHEQE